VRNELGNAVERRDRVLIRGNFRAFLYKDREDPRKSTATNFGAPLNVRTAGISDTSLIIDNVLTKLTGTFKKIRGFDGGWNGII
jgi:hypothetical protein